MECITLPCKAIDFPWSNQKWCDEYFKLRAATCVSYKAPLEGCNCKHQYILFPTQYSFAVDSQWSYVNFIDLRENRRDPMHLLQINLSSTVKSHIYSGSLKTSNSALPSSPEKTCKFYGRCITHEKFIGEKKSGREDTCTRSHAFSWTSHSSQRALASRISFSMNPVPWMKLAVTFQSQPNWC